MTTSETVTGVPFLEEVKAELKSKRLFNGKLSAPEISGLFTQIISSVVEDQPINLNVRQMKVEIGKGEYGNQVKLDFDGILSGRVETPLVSGDVAIDMAATMRMINSPRPNHKGKKVSVLVDHLDVRQFQSPISVDAKRAVEESIQGYMFQNKLTGWMTEEGIPVRSLEMEILDDAVALRIFA